MGKAEEKFVATELERLVFMLLVVREELRNSPKDAHINVRDMADILDRVLDD